ncbi:MAG: 16S rRNA (guanine(527)-N(7))-methyltransferase RsmG [Clostridia bacterium]|nr:16S rRNA (guanine(527)-N(7))-methyltransferase RsmG [Clostridia bacterium]
MLSDLLIQRAAAMGIGMTKAQAEQFEAYHALLTDANARMNLTRVAEDASEAADRNYLDCIAVLAGDFPRVETAVDVGSGAGFPGIPLAIMLPRVRFTLIDALGKRVDFLRRVIDRLGLNAEALHLRAEDAARQPALRETFDLATARAVAPMNVLCEYLLPLVRPGGWALALKGPGLDEELIQAGGALRLLGGEARRVQPLAIPGRDWDHRAAWIAKTAPTPDKYPRRPGVAEKKPL